MQCATDVYGSVIQKAILETYDVTKRKRRSGFRVELRRSLQVIMDLILFHIAEAKKGG